MYSSWRATLNNARDGVSTWGQPADGWQWDGNASNLLVGLRGAVTKKFDMVRAHGPGTAKGFVYLAQKTVQLPFAIGFAAITDEERELASQAAQAAMDRLETAWTPLPDVQLGTLSVVLDDHVYDMTGNMGDPTFPGGLQWLDHGGVVKALCEFIVYDGVVNVTVT